MPRLLLLRHAQAEMGDGNISDFFRPLSRNGLKDAEKCADYIAENGLYPQQIICSSARRTRETLSALLPLLPEECDIRLSRHLYEATGHDIISLIHQCQDAEILMLIGHNPAISQAARVLAMRGQDQALKHIQAGFSECNLAIIDFDVPTWDSLIPGNGWAAAFWHA